MKQNIYIDDIIVFGSCGGHKSYVIFKILDIYSSV
jgi:hypothetical protein